MVTKGTILATTFTIFAICALQWLMTDIVLSSILLVLKIVANILLSIIDIFPKIGYDIKQLGLGFNFGFLLFSVYCHFWKINPTMTIFIFMAKVYVKMYNLLTQYFTVLKPLPETVELEKNIPVKTLIEFYDGESNIINSVLLNSDDVIAELKTNDPIAMLDTISKAISDSDKKID